MREYLGRPQPYLVLLLALTAGVYWTSLGNPFHIDDFHGISENPHIRTIQNIPAFFGSADYFSVLTGRHNMYRPVLLSSYSVNHWLSGLDPAGFRSVNLWVHLASVLLVYWLLRRLLDSLRLALIGASLFALHPFQSEAVNYISARSSTLATAFFILSVILFFGFRTQQARNGGRVKVLGSYIAFLISFILALLTKEISLTLPAVLILLDLVVLRVSGWRELGQRGLAYLPFLIVALSFSFRIDLFGFLASVQFVSVATLAQVLFMAPKLLLWPLGLAADHPVLADASLFQWAILTQFILLSALLLWGVRMTFAERIESRVAAFFIFWYFLTSLPTSLFPLNQVFVEHRGYLPAVGLIGLGAVGIERALRWGQGAYGLRAVRSAYVLGAVVALMMGFGIVDRSHAWKDAVILWGDALKKYPESKLGRLFLADAHLKRGDREKARALYQGLLERDPGCRHGFSCSKAHYALASLSAEEGRWEAALEGYQAALRVVPNSYMIRYRMGTVHHRMGDLQMAQSYYRKALEKNPDAYEVFYAMGMLHESRGEHHQAEKAYSAVLDRMPSVGAARLRLAGVLVRQGEVERAQAEYEEILKAGADHAEAYRGLGYIHELQKDWPSAAGQYEKAIAAGAREPGFYYHLGSIYQKMGRTQKARERWEQCLELAPQFWEARYSLARLLAQEGLREGAVAQYRILKEKLPSDAQYAPLSARVEAELMVLEGGSQETEK